MALFLVLRRHYPDFEALLNAIPDHRRRHTYEVSELLDAGLLMFVLRLKSRHQTDQMAGKQFEGKYRYGHPHDPPTNTQEKQTRAMAFGKLLLPQCALL